MIQSAYLARVSPSHMLWNRCYYCGLRLTDLPGPQNRTRDHILPRQFGRMVREVRNLRPCCKDCNQLRAVLGHCSGALMLAILHAEVLHCSPKIAATNLGMWHSSAPERYARRYAKRVARHTAKRAKQEMQAP